MHSVILLSIQPLYVDLKYSVDKTERNIVNFKITSVVDCFKWKKINININNAVCVFNPFRKESSFFGCSFNACIKQFRYILLCDIVKVSLLCNNNQEFDYLNLCCTIHYHKYDFLLMIPKACIVFLQKRIS